jgi:hypothetical protein
VKVEILYFDGCPSWQDALVNLREVLGDTQPIDLIRIETPEEAQAEQFAGSPTIRIDGRDLFPHDRSDYALACRVYQAPGGQAGVPTVEMIEEALRYLSLSYATFGQTVEAEL